METEERKQAAAELRRLPAQHGPAAGIAGSRRVRTAEEEREHADFVSPEKREERREDGEKKKERLHKEKQKRLQDQKKKKLEDEQKAKDKRYADKTKKAPPPAPSLADAAARGLTAANVRALSSGAGPSSSRDDDDASNSTADTVAKSVATSAWPMEKSDHAVKQQERRAITDREIQECLKHGDKETQAKGRIKHRHPLYNHGSRIVAITEANGTTVVTEFDRDNDL